MSEERSARNLHDVVVNHIFATGLTLAGILSLQRVDAEVTERLQCAIHELDTAIRELRTATFAHVVADNEPWPEPPGVEPADVRRHLCHVADSAVFAYAMGGHDFYRAIDHELWAHESDDLLLSARSGTPLAHRVGDLFCDIETHVPLYHEDGSPTLVPSGLNATD